MRQEQENDEQAREAGPKPIKVLMVARQGVLRQAMAELLNYHQDVEVVSLVEDMRQANRWCLQGNAHVIILDWPLADPHELHISGDIATKHTDCRCLAVSLYDDPFSVKQAFDLGVRGYVSKAMVAEMMYTAIQAVHAGRRFCSPDVVDMLPAAFLDHIEIGSQD